MNERSCFRNVFAAMTFLLLAVPSLAQTSDGLPEYREGNYEKAIPLLQSALKGTPDDPVKQAALLSALVYQGRVEDATEAANGDKDKFPNSAAVLAARGDYAFYLGQMTTAQNLFSQAYKLDPKCARAVFGLARLMNAASHYRTGRLMVMQAHNLDPDDAGITRYWIRYLVGAKREELFAPFAKAHPWFYPNIEEAKETEAAVTKQLNGSHDFEPDGKPEETTLRLNLVRHGPDHVSGIGLHVKLENGLTLFLQFDTGASGITLNQRIIDRIGLAHLGTSHIGGIGDAGWKDGFYAVAQTCEIGSLKFKHCVVEAIKGKERLDEVVDGLIGADVFSDYLVDLDFMNRTCHLTPLPEQPVSAQSYDRVISPQEQDFTPIYRVGHELLLPTRLNDKASGLFLLDTGADFSNVDTTFARTAMKVRHSDVEVRGVSGKVKNVMESENATLEFAHFRQDNFGLLAIDLNDLPGHEEIRMSGILGLSVLQMFRMQLDYRNGLVKFDYIFGKKEKAAGN